MLEYGHIKIALLEDNPADCRLLQEILSEVSDFTTAIEPFGKLGDFLKVFTHQDFDILLLDLGLPDSQGEDTVRAVAELKPHYPIVVLTGLDDKRLGMQTITWGADDFILKSTQDPEFLSHVIRYAIERKKVQSQIAFSLEVMNVINRCSGMEECIKEVLRLIQGFTKAEAIGIRLKEGDDYPYYLYNGFSDEFLASENTLIVNKSPGFNELSGSSDLQLDCLCGYIINGKEIQPNTHFTAGGSFVTQCLSELVSKKALAALNLPTRGVCCANGYESLAIIPIKNQSHNYGTIQLNDTNRNQFSKSLIEVMEGVGVSMGLAISKIKAKEKLNESEGQLRFILENTQAGIFMIKDDDHTILYANSVALKLLDRTNEDVIGKPCHEFICPNQKGVCPIRDQGKTIHNTECALLVRGGGAIPILKTASVFIFNNQRVYLETFIDITVRKHAQENLQEQLKVLQRWQRVTINREERIQQLKREVNQLLLDADQPIRYPSQNGNSD